MCQFVVAHADDEIHVGKHVFRLKKLLRVTVMKQVVDAVGENAHRTPGCIQQEMKEIKENRKEGVRRINR